MRRIGIDTGGTFTDLVSLKDGKLVIDKRPSTPLDPALAVQAALESCDSIIRPKEITYGSTIATNAILERKGARVFLITTAGFESILFIGRQNRPDLYALSPEKPEPLIDPKMVTGINERTLYNGVILQKVTGIVGLLNTIPQENTDAVAVCLLHSYANPSNELQVYKKISEIFPEIPITLSSKLLPEYREYERTSTTVMNAYVHPIVAEHLSVLSSRIGPGQLRIMQSNGGSISAERASKEPVRTVLSGPAGGVIGAIHAAKFAGYKDILTFDMGGTSTDVSLVHGKPSITSDYEISGLPLRIPVLDIHTVGAGGGSICQLDPAGALRVGPHSAGAVPGPICYGNGGTELTVTDANLILGRLDGKNFLGGKRRLDLKTAMDSLKNLSEELGMNSLELAEGIIKIANATMQRALVKISVQRGYDPRDFTLVTYGGAGGLHACELARELGIKRVLIPENPGVLSAYGMILTDVIKDYSRSFMKSSKEINFNAIAEAFLPLENAAMSELVKEKFDPLRVVLARSIDLRYKRQSFELNVPFSKTYIQDFHRLHHERYGHSDLKEKVEIVNLRLEGRGVTDKPPTVVPDIMENKIEDSVIGETRIFYDGKESDAAIIDRKRLAPHNSLDGPVLITEYTATTFIPPGFSMRVNSYGGIEIW